MQLSPVSSLLSASPFLTSPTYDNPTQTLAAQGGSTADSSIPQNQTSLNATIEAESLNVQDYSLDYTTKDGDHLTLSMESVQYQQATINVSATGSADDMQKISDYMKQLYDSMKDQLMGSLKGSTGTDNTDASGTVAPTQTSKTDAAQVPDYWSAENTSQRIVDFATSFFSAFKGQGADFLKTITDAIEKGFKEAEGQLGKLPDSVNNLVQNTHDLVMQKLDQWAQSNGITTDTQAGVADQTSTAEQKLAA